MQCMTFARKTNETSKHRNVYVYRSKVLAAFFPTQCIFIFFNNISNVSCIYFSQDNNGISKKKSLKTNPNLTVKKIKSSKAQQNVNKIPMEKVSMPTVQNNNTKITVMFRNQSTPQQSIQSIPSALKKIPQLRNAGPIQNAKRPLQKVNFSSSITITPYKDGLPINRASPIIQSKDNSVRIVQNSIPANHGTVKMPVMNTSVVSSAPVTKTKLTAINPHAVNPIVSIPTNVRVSVAKPTTVNSLNTAAINPTIVNRTVTNPAGIARLGTHSPVQKPSMVVIPVTHTVEPDPLAISPRTDQPVKIPPTMPRHVNSGYSRPAKRIAPTKISDTVTIRASSMEKSSDSDVLSRDSSSVTNDETVTNNNLSNGDTLLQEYQPSAKRLRLDDQPDAPIDVDFLSLIEVCKRVDPSEDMKKITAKMEKYYRRAHTDYVKSKSFTKLVKGVTTEIEKQPKLVYMKVNNVSDELKTRRTMENSNAIDEPTKESAADEKKRKKIDKLSAALRVLQKRIRRSEEAEVDFDDELNSKYLVTERYKKRACEIYEKLCDLTGESRSAERIVKKPIKFSGTRYPEFNKKLEKFINDTKSFPDMFDVMRIMDHCNTHYKYKLDKAHRDGCGK